MLNNQEFSYYTVEIYLNKLTLNKPNFNSNNFGPFLDFSILIFNFTFLDVMAQSYSVYMSLLI